MQLNLKLYYIILLFYSSNTFYTYSQESIIPITRNNELENNKLGKKTSPTKKDNVISLQIPFFDDFSYASDQQVFPSNKLWVDNHVYVNRQYGINSPTLGVATFDILNKNGLIYEQAAYQTFFKADTLTSKPINLKNLSIADSIYLSFMYQPGGYGDIPETSDSLILQFKSSKKDWLTIWSISGPNQNNVIQPFKTVMIKINNVAWLDSVFQFRFINIGSIVSSNNVSNKGLRTNADIWNLDYVYLNKNRHLNDTTFNDIAIIEPLESFLKNFRSIPWKHYQNAFYKVIKEKINLKIFNFSNTSSAVEGNLRIQNVYENYWDEPISNAIDINGYSYSSFEFECPILRSEHNDSALFAIKSYIVTNKFDPKQNDTVVSYQFFKDYYAYDDGTPEYGYGLLGNNITHGHIAMKFETFIPDTLVAVDIYFNKSLNDENHVYFNLYVWNDINQFPSDSIGGKKECKIQTSKFTRYWLEQPIVPPLSFYIGLQQIDETFLNIGYDRNSPMNEKIYYNIGNEWQKSALKQKGSLMIRPIFKKITSSVNKNNGSKNFSIFPNPITDKFKVTGSFSDIHNSKLYIYHLNGQMVYMSNISKDQSFSIGHLTPGIYLLKIIDTYGISYYSKITKL